MTRTRHLLLTLMLLGLSGCNPVKTSPPQASDSDLSHRGIGLLRLEAAREDIVPYLEKRLRLPAQCRIDKLGMPPDRRFHLLETCRFDDVSGRLALLQQPVTGLEMRFLDRHLIRLQLHFAEGTAPNALTNQLQSALGETGGEQVWQQGDYRVEQDMRRLRFSHTELNRRADEALAAPR